MSDTIAAIAISVAVIAAIIGFFFYPGEVWAALNRKTPHGNSAADAPVGPSGGGPNSDCNGDGSA